MLTHEEVQRYSRHITLPGIGVEGQVRLKRARVLCIGAGGLGSPAALYLAAAGVGTLGLVDFDAVDLSNIQRQILHGTPDVGRSKLASASDRLRAINPAVGLDLHEVPFTAANAADLVSRYDIIVDGTDNFPARYLVNDACVMVGRPNVYGSIFRFEGQAAVFATPGGPCYRCLHPEPPPAGLIPSCAEAGVLGVLPGVIGTIQATETLKLILGIGEPLVGRFLIYDALRMRFRELKLPRDPECPVCGDRPVIRELVEYEAACETRAEPVAPGVSAEDISPCELAARMTAANPPLVIDVREPVEHQICRIPGARLVPLGQLEAELPGLEPGREIVVHCKTGARSARAASVLRARGFAGVRNLSGGILAWIDQVDPTQPKY
ncbi:MAG TPA: molybdopterin-synthase adenylyltransferase MoeB [Vicinamibacterales bacterium]|nr:molybdopterin-synthase adenylyltransferase MoeB [Vicinamibacterales bacterium]